MDLPDIVRFLGRLHPVVLHFPIGFLVAVLLLEGFRLLRPAWRLGPATSILLPLACASAVVTATLGLLLSWSGGYDEATLWRHEWLGIAVAALSLVLVALWWLHRRRGNARLLDAYRALLLASVVVLSAAGHQGAALTHGPNYLTRYLPAWLGGGLAASRLGAPALPATGGLYERQVAGIFEARCLECHGPDKQKGGLRLDARRFALAGGDSGLPAIVPGDALASRLVRFIVPPWEHEGAMPPEGKTRLSPAEIVAIVDWINRGAPWNDRIDEIAARVAAPDPAAIEALRSLGAQVSLLFEGSPLLRVSFAPARERIGDAELQALAPLAAQITWLDLAGSRVSNEGLAHVARLVNLTRLHLEETQIGDAGLAHLESLSELTYLNLYGTRTTDAGLVHLAPLERLESLFLWQTEVTPEGIALLERPQLAIDVGGRSLRASAEGEPS